MFKFSELKIIQIEISNRCQASCPMCPRNIHGGIENPLLPLNDWTLENFIKIFPVEVLGQLEILNFCGDFGDPLMNNDLIDMCKYVKETAPDVKIDIHTNGSLRSTAWWKDLANALPKKHSVYFGIDGLEDTQHIYRIGTSFDKIIKNAKTFIDAGGIAEWHYIKFKHNQHQIDAAKDLSIELGFKKFSVKTSKRNARPFPVVDKQGNFLYNIEQPTESEIKFVGKADVEGHQQWKDADKINCVAIKEKELYIDAHYQLSPCCMVGAFLYTNYDVELYKKYNLYEEDSIIEEGEKVRQQVLQFPKFNVLETGLKNIVETDQWQTMWQQKWQERSSSTCIIMCGPRSPYITARDQKITLIDRTANE
jgi:MoaA/NifB/PqqE/SkfB family radical SAM enzyme